MKIFCVLSILVLVGLLDAAFGGKPCAGCPYEDDPNNVEVRKTLELAVKKQNDKSNDEPINVKTIHKTTKQIVAGVKTTCVYEGEGAKSKALYECRTVYLVQQWISPEPQVLEHSCTKRPKRNVGGPKDVSPEEIEQVKEFVQSGLETLDELDADDNKRVVVHLIDAKKQLVNGVMYHVSVKVKTTSCPEGGMTNADCLKEEIGPQKICKLQIYQSFVDKSPHNAKVVKSECDAIMKERSIDHHHHHHDPAAPLDRAAQYATKMINNALNSNTVKGLVHVLESDTSFQSDTHTMAMILELGDTNCTKQKSSEAAECLIGPTLKHHMICNVNVVHDEKTDKLHLHSVSGTNGFNCKDVKAHKGISNRARRALVGGERPLSLSSENIGDLKDFISTALTQDSTNVKKVATVISASYQITSGRVVKMLVEIANTDCLNVELGDDQECSLLNEGRVLCRMSIWEKPWLNSKEIVSNECSPIEPSAEVLQVDESNDHLNKFKKFTAQYNRAYPTVKELNKRFRIFRANMKKADYLQKTEQGSATYGVTMFSDLTSAEFKKHYLGLKKPLNSGNLPPMEQAVIPDIVLPDEFDWRSYNIVTPVKNQGLCGSCWAFSVTGNIEGQYALKTGKLVSLSEQELVDCDKYDDGCEGGFFDTAYHAIEELGGLESESDYPYTGRDGKCHFESSEVRVNIRNALNISHNETDMAKWLVRNGPISIALNANAMQFYVGGVSHPLKFLCNPKDLDHGVLLVGYGVHKTWLLHRHLPYWLIKNSWGPHWGHKGYYMLYRGGGTCGVNQSPSSAVL